MESLNALGSSTPLRRSLFPQGFAGQVMRHVLETWEAFSLHRQVRLENRINASFCEALKDACDASGRNWIIVPEYPINDPIRGVQLGRIDLCFLPSEHHGQKVFFTLECKRLRVRTKSGLRHMADKYVEKGLQRFVDGKYSANHPCGGMLGYVMDNQVDDALESIQREIEKRRIELKMKNKKPICVPSKVLPSHRCSLDTLHSRPDGTLTIHHLLIGVVR